MRRLATQEKHLGDGLLSALLDIMAMDSDKHARILELALERLSASR
jgi:hypothetical protein